MAVHECAYFIHLGLITSTAIRRGNARLGTTLSWHVDSNWPEKKYIPQLNASLSENVSNHFFIWKGTLSSLLQALELTDLYNNISQVPQFYWQPPFTNSIVFSCASFDQNYSWSWLREAFPLTSRLKPLQRCSEYSEATAHN